jgi:putative ABC transport system ATP-binding protein
MSVLEVEGLVFGWRRDEPLLRLPSLRLEAGEHLFIHGPSGSGKSTLLNLLAGALTPQAGHISLLGQPFSSLKSGARDVLRAAHMGYIFQMFNLLPYLSALDNVLLPCRFSPARRARAGGARADEAARQLLTELDIGPSLWPAHAMRLSTGQQQRVAAARALLGAPELVIADEPTSALDAELRDSFVNLLFTRCAAIGAALILVSHDPALAARFSRRLDVRDFHA